MRTAYAFPVSFFFITYNGNKIILLKSPHMFEGFCKGAIIIFILIFISQVPGVIWLCTGKKIFSQNTIGLVWFYLKSNFEKLETPRSNLKWVRNFSYFLSWNLKKNTMYGTLYRRSGYEIVNFKWILDRSFFFLTGGNTETDFAYVR